MEARGPCLSSAATQVSRASAEPNPARAVLRRALLWGTEGSGATSCLHSRHLAACGCAGGLRSRFSALGSPGDAALGRLCPGRGAAGVPRDHHPQAG